MIALLCAVETECTMLRRQLAAGGAADSGPLPFLSGSLAGRDVVLCIGGMGKANAAHATALLAERYAPQALIVFGIGGAYPSSGARVGDVAIAREEIAGDEGVLTPDGFHDTRHLGIPLLRTASRTIYSAYPAPDDGVRTALRALDAFPGANVFSGTFVTLSTCTGTAARARELEERHQGLCENMEGAAAAHVAMLHDIPWIEVRGISNIVEDRAPEKWDIPRAARAAEEAVLLILGGWDR